MLLSEVKQTFFSIIFAGCEGEIRQAEKWQIISQIAGTFQSAHTINYFGIKMNKINQSRNGSTSVFCTQPVIFPWQPSLWQFGSRSQWTNQMTNQQRCFHHTSTQTSLSVSFIPAHPEIFLSWLLIEKKELMKKKSARFILSVNMNCV